ncbi:hypothetical protein EMIT093MI4_110007 [Pseudomonas sp. IT-93MI4]
MGAEPELRTLLHWRDLLLERRYSSGIDAHFCRSYRKRRATLVQFAASLLISGDAG